jgi:hypothetical protein
VARSCKDGNEPSGSLKDGEFIRQLSELFASRKGSATCIYLV